MEVERDPSQNHPTGGTDTNADKSSTHPSRGHALGKLPLHSWNNSAQNDTVARAGAAKKSDSTR